MVEFDLETLAVDDVADSDDFADMNIEDDVAGVLFIDENGASYYFKYFWEFHSLANNEILYVVDEPEIFMSQEELDSFVEEDNEFKYCYYYNEHCWREE